MKGVLALTGLLLAGAGIRADEPKRLIDVAYGKHPRQVLDFYQAKSEKPTPAVFYIHGGGWQNGDKKINPQPFLAKGISVVAINYRYVKNGVEEKIKPPVKAPLEDAARALQFVRSKAAAWNLDKKRIGATGGSAGGCSSLWLAFHDDMADPTSKDPIARESTRLYCAAVNGAQTSLDPKELRAWMPNYRYGAHAFGLPSFQSLMDNRAKVLKWIKEYSPIEHVSKDDPPIGLFYGGDKNAKVGDSPKDPTHSPILGIKLAEKLKSVGVDVVLVYPGRPHPKYKSSADYLIDRLLKKPATPAEQYKAFRKEHHEVIHEAGNKDAQPLPKSLIEAWTNAGADVCWLRVDELGFLKVIPRKEGKLGDVPGFTFVRWQEGRLAKLPVPDAAFGLYLARTEVTDAGLKELVRLKSLQALCVDVTKLTDVGLKALAGLQRLQGLSLDFTKVTDAGLKDLAGLQRLQTLRLNSTQVTDAGMKDLARVKTLHTVDLGGTPLSDAGLKELAGLKSLRALVLPRTRVTNAGLKELAGLKGLQILNVRFSKVTDAGLKELAGFKNLNTLNLNLTKVTDAGMKDLAALQSLQALNLSYSQVTDAGLTELAALKRLHTLNLGGTTVTDAGLKKLSGLKTLQTLHLDATRVTDAGVTDLRKTVPGCKILGVPAAKTEGKGKPATPAEQYKALLTEYQAASQDIFSRTKTDEERNKMLGRVDKFPLRFLELAEKYPKDPIALDVLVQVINLEISLENNTTYAGRGKEDSPQARAIALLLRDHLGSEKLDYACWRASYGFHKDCEKFLRTVLDKSPHKEVQGTACFRLAQFLKTRLHRLDLLKERPEMARRYESLFGKDYLVKLQRQDPAKGGAEVEALFVRAAEKYGDVKLPYSGTIGERAKTELHEIRNLSVGKIAQEIEGQDQDGKRFKLSDYRGKVVLLYFWSEY